MSLSPQEALARDLIAERVAAGHRRAQRAGAPRRRHTRVAGALRALAEHLDPPAGDVAAPGPARVRSA
jgi:hypothetical protein